MTIGSTKLARSVISLLCVLAMLFGLTTTVMPTVSAASVIPTLTAGYRWRHQWDATQPEMYLNLSVTETGFHTLTVNDYKKTGCVMVSLYDSTDMTYLGGVWKWGTDTPYVSEQLFMRADHGYYLKILYGNHPEMTEFYEADLSITFERTGYVPAEIPSTAPAANNVILEAGERQWFRVTTEKAGDYTVKFSDPLRVKVSVYEASKGTLVGQRDTQYYFNDGWRRSNKATFRLKANRDYYILIENSTDPIQMNVSMSKAFRDVSTIKLCTGATALRCWTDARHIASYVGYTVTYTSGGSMDMDYGYLCEQGLERPTVTYLGKTVSVNGETLLVAGTHPVMANYRDSLSYTTVKIRSVTDWLIEAEAPEVSGTQWCRLRDDGEVNDLGYFRVKVAKSGVYVLNWDSETSSQLKRATIVLLDKNNYPVNYSGAFPLIAGQEYAVSVRYTYKDDATIETRFKLPFRTTTLFGDVRDDNQWYYDAVAYTVGRGIMTGYKSGPFGVSDSIQRQDFLVMLARFDGVDLTDYADRHGQFPDVAKNSYYEAAVAWGYENGIVTGYQNGRFGVGDRITREQLVTFLYRYAQYKRCDVSYSAIAESTVNRTYIDEQTVSAFAKSAVIWAIDNGVIKGKTATKIVPQGTAQRCEVAQMMYNIFKNNVF